MTKDELLNRIKSHFVIRFYTLVFKNSKGDLKLFSVDNLVYLCEKVYNIGFENGKRNISSE